VVSFPFLPAIRAVLASPKSGDERIFILANIIEILLEDLNMSRKRQRNRATEEYVARQQAYALGGGLQPEDLVKLIDAKGGDYYRAELNPREGWREAYDHFGMTGKRETLDLQEEIKAEMKGYYGLNTPAQVPQAAVPGKAQPIQPAPISEPVPAPVAAQAYKDEAVQDVINNQSDEVDNRVRDFVKDHETSIRNSALLSAVGLGGIAYHQSRQPEEEVNVLLPS
jgi:hypothetical protein